MDQIIEKYFICNGKKLDTSQFSELHKENISPAIYEVIRVIDGVPLFLEQHIERLNKSSSMLNYSIFNIIDKIKEDIRNIINLNNSPDKNIKLLVYGFEKEIAEYTIYFIKSSYPTNEQYTQGVKTVLYNAQRNNPNVKLINTKFKSEVSILLEKSNAYEAILVNHDNYVTEGSRSNLFFIKENTIYTSPLKDVLPGVTRTNVITLCNSLNIDIKEKAIDANEIKNYDGIFMTGTSPKILPISEIDDMKYTSAMNPLLKQLIREFDIYIFKYIESFK